MKLNQFNYWKYIRWLGISSFILSPFIGAWYVNKKMRDMEKGIHDDLRRIRTKGRNVGDIPRRP
jgi:hypothetical protein